MGNAGIKGAQGREPQDREIPFSRKVAGKVTWYEDQSSFYEHKDEIAQAEKEWKSLRGKERITFYKENGGVIRMRGKMEATEKQLKRLRKRRDGIEENAGLTEKQKDEKLEKIEEQMKLHIDRFNKD